MKAERPLYNRAMAALEAAHKACFKHADRPLLGMSHGPFSGVNEVLGIVAELERENVKLTKKTQKLEAKIRELKAERSA